MQKRSWTMSASSVTAVAHCSWAMLISSIRQRSSSDSKNFFILNCVSTCMSINYGNIWVGEYGEFVVEELKQRRKYSNTRTGTIRAILSQNTSGHYIGTALDDYIVDHCEKERVHRLDFV